MKKRLILKGGLGNQMFIYALYLRMKSLNIDVMVDASLYSRLRMHNGCELHKLGIQEEGFAEGYWTSMTQRVLNKIFGRWLCFRDENIYDEYIFKTHKIWIDGYWQNEEYFRNIEEQIRTCYQFKGIDEKNKEIADHMHKCNSVSLHIRRGDYYEYGMSLLGDDYYKKAVDFIKSKVEDPYFYIFSDDEKVASDVAKQLKVRYMLISINKGNDSYKDMYLMSQCKHNIIANSSFSWWGAWLNTSLNKIVIAPQIWDSKNKNIHPQSKSWILL